MNEIRDPAITPGRSRRAAARARARLINGIISRIVAIALTVVVLWLTADLTFARSYVAAALILCFGLQLRFPQAWLLYLPALLPVCDLGLWSGRIYVNEFDLLVLTTATAHFWRAPDAHQFPNLATKGGAIIALLSISFLVSTLIGAIPLPSPDVNQFANYLSPYNALRVAKSIGWALLLLAPLQYCLSRDAAKTSSLFVIGVSIGLALVGIAVLWERGVLLAVAQSHNLWTDRYIIGGALLDFTSGYRATALFTELHTGGEAMDAYMALATPFAAAGVLGLRHPLWRLLCLVALGLGTYAVVAGFSRGLYAGYASAMLTVFVLAIVLGRRSGLQGRFALLRAVSAAAIAAAALVAAYIHGGWTALAFGLAFGGAALLVTHVLGTRFRLIAALLLAVIVAGGAYKLFDAFLASRYSEMDAHSALLWAGICATGLGAAAALLGGRVVPPERRFATAMLFAVFAVVCLIAIPAASGYRMVERFSTSSADAETRWDHWAETVRLMAPDARDYAFGMGLGSFPRIYFRRGIGPETKVSFRFDGDGTKTWVELGAADYNLMQKIPLKPHTKYELKVMTRGNDAGARMSLKFCPKLILYDDRYTPGCPSFGFQPNGVNAWTSDSVVLDSGGLGNDAFNWPITLLLHNEADTVSIQVTGIEVTDSSGNIVANGDFSAGGDRWILISDFEHLAWHIKNLYLEVFFENGAVGLSIFLFALVAAVATIVRMARQWSPVGIGIAGALVGFMVVGLVGSLLDNPRPAFLFFLILFWALQPPPRLAAKPKTA